MKRWRPVRGPHPAVPLLLCALLGVPPAWAQQARPPTLDQILQGLEDHLRHYDASVPSFFCDEHAVSKVFPGQHDQDTVTDSIFRLKRVLNADQTTSLDESREIKRINGQPATTQDIDGLTALSGAFEGGLAVVSLSQKSCMHYTLEHIKSNRPKAPYIIRFTTVSAAQRSGDCLLQEDGKGRVFIDPATLQITHMELTVPHHVINPGHRTASGYQFPPTIGEWVLSVDYAPVQLSGQTFWMPATITSHSSTGRNTFTPTFWSFTATYRNYHKLEVSSRILPADGSPAP